MKTFEVQGSTGNIYTVTVNGDDYTCECKSFLYRHTCKHIEKVRKKKENQHRNMNNKEEKNFSKTKIKLSKDSIAKLRKKLLLGSTTNRNKLINFKHSDRSRGQVRIVDEMPDFVYSRLFDEKSFIFKPLPEPESEPKDEKTTKFLSAFEVAKKEDSIFLKEIEKMGDEYDENNKESLKVERELKDRVRIKLGMEERLTPEVLGINDYAKKIGINPNFDLPSSKDELSGRHQDKYLQTILLPYQMEKKLLGTRRLAKSALNEKGINTLYLAFGFIEWYESPNSDQKMLSPILLLPVNLEERKKTKGSEFCLSNGDHSLQINIALKAKFEQDIGISLENPEEEETPEKYLKKLEENIKDRDRWKIRRFITLGHFQFARMAMYYDLDPKLWNETSGGLGSQKNLVEIFSGTESSDGSDAEDYEVDKKEIAAKVPLLLNQADSSQFSAIVDAMDGKNIAIQGPPGTGKSQTITNIIGSALANGKKVLFIADKKAALDVVYKKLRDVNLDKFCLKIDSSNVKKVDVIKTIKERVEYKSNFIKELELQSDILKERDIKKKLIEYANLLSTKIGNSEKTIYELKGLIAKYKSVGEETSFYETLFENYNKEIGKKILEITPEQIEIIGETLSSIEDIFNNFKKDYKNINDHPWYGFANTQISPYDKKELKKLIQNICTELEDYLKNLDKIKSELAINIKNNAFPILDEANSINGIKNLINMFSKLEEPNKSLNINSLKKINSIQDIEKIELFKKDLKLYEEKSQIEKEVKERLRFKKSELKKIKDAKEIIEKSHFLSFFTNSKYVNAKHFYVSLLKSGNYSKKQALLDLNLLIEYAKSINSINTLKDKIKNNQLASKVLEKDFSSTQTKISVVDNILTYLNHLKSIKTDNQNILFILKNSEKIKLIKKNEKFFDKFLKKIELDINEFSNNTEKNKFFSHLQKTNYFSQQERKKYARALGVDEELADSVAKKDDFVGDADFEILLKKLIKCDLTKLDSWVSFIKSRNSLSTFESIIINYYDKNNVPYTNLKQIFRSTIYNSLLAFAYKQHQNLSDFDGDKLDSWRKKYRILDKKIFEKKKKQLLTLLANLNITQGVTTGSTKKLTEFGLINRIIDQTRPQVALRDLIKRSSTCLSELKPCFLMSPVTLSELVRPEENLFDLLIIDEASQMKPEEAISALARSKQCIIVGDPKQLAPSSFFDPSDFSDDDDDEDDVTEESILDLALSRFKPKRVLKWHYRSRSEKLINFSNKYFYNSQLIIPPSPILKKPIHHNFVQSTYQGKINDQEKESLVAEVIDFMKNNVKKGEDDKKAKSCLVVTMNQSQKELIEDELRLRSNTEKIIRDYELSWMNTLEPLTVKNLENVQGDERDCIFISTLFGPNKEGRVLQLFGPINHKGKGHRRLNVLFTRAKHEVRLFTSMHPNQIQVEGAPEGRQVFKAYIEYAKTGRLEIGDTKKGLEPMSEFEIWVKEGLEKMGYEVTPQVGVSGFFIDLGIKHKSYPDGYILGVECDGRTYHSSRSARDRDILRQNVLEDQGWKIYRIWSTDWFKDPQKELRKLDQHIKGII